jgi:hypothetical protein
MSRSAGRRPGENDAMEHHGPTDLNGPVRGTNVWWHGTTEGPEAVDGPPADAATEKGKRMKGRKRGNRRSTGEAIRPELVERIRNEIAAGTYDSPEKWEAALDCLLDRLERD